jgi:hypothetical protein
MIVKRVKCDNPGCPNTESPEWESANGRNFRPPYGWLRMAGWFQGTGPKVQVDVCSIACLEAAVEAVVAEDRDR